MLHARISMLAIVAALLGPLTLDVTADEQGTADKQDKTKDHRLTIAGGKLSITASGQWTVKKPAVRIIEHELSVPAVKGDGVDGRMLMMQAGGSVEKNLDRWYGQFTQPDGKSTKDRAKLKKIKIAGRQIVLVDVSGTYNDRRGPFAPAVKRANFRMLAAIVSLGGKKDGAAAPSNYFIKFYGPKKTVAANEKAFMTMIQSLKPVGRRQP